MRDGGSDARRDSLDMRDGGSDARRDGRFGLDLVGAPFRVRISYFNVETQHVASHGFTKAGRIMIRLYINRLNRIKNVFF